MTDQDSRSGFMVRLIAEITYKHVPDAPALGPWVSWWKDIALPCGPMLGLRIITPGSGFVCLTIDRVEYDMGVDPAKEPPVTCFAKGTDQCQFESLKQMREEYEKDGWTYEDRCSTWDEWD